MTTLRKFQVHASDSLLLTARKAANASYSPYSRFRVGAAVSAGGKVYSGTNIENGSYGLTMCAERVAIFAAIADGNRAIDALAVVCVDATHNDPPNMKVPCGACRQVLEEFANKGTKVVIDGVGEFELENLLPIPFSLANQSRDDLK